MSEQKKMTILQPGQSAIPNAGLPNPQTVSAADTMGGSMPAEPTKRKGLPAEGEPWKIEHDMVVMGRLARAVEGVPPAAMRRITPWFSGVLNTACQEPVDPRLLAKGYGWQNQGQNGEMKKAAEEELYQGLGRLGSGR